MADNLTGPLSGTGTATPVIATDEIGLVHYQRVKPSLGPDGTAVDAKGLSDLNAGAESGVPATGWGPGWHRSIADVNATGATTATIYTGGCATVVIDVSGTFTGLSASVQGSMDNGTTYADVHTFQSFELLNSRGETTQSGIGTARRYLVSPAGYTHIRYNVTAVSTGTAVIKVIAQPVPYALVPSNQHFVLLSSAARTTTTASSDVSNYHNRGAYIYVNVTSITTTPIITVQVQGKEPVGNTYFTIAEFIPISAVGSAVFQVYPGADYIEGIAVSASLPRTWRVNVVHADADSITYSVGVMGLL